jgi:rhamnosyltransferase subunit B
MEPSHPPYKRMLLVTLGTAGDVFPLLGVGRALRERGYEVQVASTSQYKSPIEQGGLEFLALNGIPGATDHPDYYHPTRSMRVVAERLLIPAIQPVYELISGLNPQDCALIANCHCYGARIAQEKLGFSLTSCVVTPFHLHSIRQLPVTPGLACPPWAPAIFRRAFLGMVSRLWDRELSPSVNGFRRKLGLAPAKDIWYEWCLSPQRVIGLFPEWFAPNPSDWPAQFAYGGFTVFDQGLTRAVPESLLASGPPLVIFAAGSAGRAAATFFQDAISASAGQPWRAVLLTGKDTTGVAEDLPENICRFDYVPLSQLLPLSSLVVHHGGLGTVSLALSSGIPQIALPFGHDQFDNAARLERLGVGRSLRHTKQLPDRLRILIERMLHDPSQVDRCRELRDRASVDHTTVRLCGLIEDNYR